LILDDILTSEEMRAVEMNSEYLGIPKLILMENAGRAVAQAIMERFNVGAKIAVVCGLGGNGGDGFVAARHLAGAGYQVEVLLLGRSGNIGSIEACTNWEAIEAMVETTRVQEIHDSAQIPKLEADVIVDALIGTGVSGTLSSPFGEMVSAINDAEAFKIAVDLPTGIESDTGDIHGEAVKADITVTFHKLKPGLLKASGNTGVIEVKQIGIPLEAERYAGPGDVYLAQKRRALDSHKGDFGYLLVIGGSETYSGAPALTGLGAYAAGVDLVYVAAPETAAHIIAGFSPSLVTVKLKGKRLTAKGLEILRPFLDRANAVAIGPGLGLHEETMEAVEIILRDLDARGMPLLVDADALKSMAGLSRSRDTEMVLTPHSGEFEALTGKRVSGSLTERGEMVGREAKRLGATILLKGHVDVISDGVHTRFNSTGNPGMTVGGTGDVLSGVTAAFLAMGVLPFQAAVSGAFINGVAGDYACAEKGYHLEPMDIVNKIPRVMEDALRNNLPRRSGASRK